MATSSGQEGDLSASFISAAEGQLGEGTVVAELEGNKPEEGYESDIEDEELPDAAEAAGEEPQDDSMHTFEGHAEAVYAVAWSPAQEDLVATGGGDDRAFIWRVGLEAFEQTGGTTHELRGHTDSVAALAFSSTGSLLATGGLDGRVKVWDSATGAAVANLEGPGEGVEWVAWHPRGEVVLAGAEDFTAWMWNARSGACLQVFSGHSGAVRCGGFTPDGRSVVTGGGEGDASLRVWNPKSGECTASIQGHPFHTAGLTALGLHSDGAVALTGAEDGSLRLSNVQTARVLAPLAGHSDSVEAVAFSRLLPLAVSASVDGRACVWDTATGAARAECGHPEAVTRAVPHPGEPLVYTACLDGAVRCWDLRTGVCVRVRTGHKEGIQDLAVSPSGRYVLTGSDDGTARVFDFRET